MKLPTYTSILRSEVLTKQVIDVYSLSLNLAIKKGTNNLHLEN